MPGKGLPQTTMNALAAQDLSKDSTPLPPMTGDYYAPDYSPPARPGWFERLHQNGFQVTDEVREMFRLLRQQALSKAATGFPDSPPKAWASTPFNPYVSAGPRPPYVVGRDLLIREHMNRKRLGPVYGAETNMVPDEKIPAGPLPPLPEKIPAGPLPPLPRTR